MANKVDVPAAHYDRLFIPVACVVSITTVDTQGRVNAASFATCVRVHHEPTCRAGRSNHGPAAGRGEPGKEDLAGEMTTMPRRWRCDGRRNDQRK